jgi:hypothetical protein
MGHFYPQLASHSLRRCVVVEVVVVVVVVVAIVVFVVVYSIYYVNEVAKSSVNDVEPYVFIKNVPDSIFNLLLLFIRR